MTGPSGPYLLAIDAGTGSCRALLFTTAGEQAAVSQQEWVHRAPPGVPGGQDFDVHANWRAIAACVRATLRAAGADGADIAAVRLMAALAAITIVFNMGIVLLIDLEWIRR